MNQRTKQGKVLRMIAAFFVIAALCMSAAVFKPQAAKAETAPTQVAQWTGNLNLTNKATINEVETKGYAWYKEAATGTPYGDLSANTLVLDGLNMISDEDYAILFEGTVATGNVLTVHLAQNSKNTVTSGEYNVYFIRNDSDDIGEIEPKTIISGEGIFEGIATSEASYSTAIYVGGGTLVQNSGEIRLDINVKDHHKGIEAARGYYLNGGKISIEMSDTSFKPESTYPIRYLIIEHERYIKEPIDGKYDTGPIGQKTVLDKDGKYPKRVVLEVTPCLHTDTETVGAVAATCTAAGYTGDVKCKDCNEEITTGEAIAKLAHTPETVGAVAATCAAAGYTGDVKCKDCKEEITKGETIAKLAHTFGAWSVTKAPTATEQGSEKRVCSACSGEETRPIAALGGGGTDKDALSPGAIAGIIIGVVLFLLLAAYVCGYFFLYRKNKLDDKKIKAIYSFLPKPKNENAADSKKE